MASGTGGKSARTGGIDGKAPRSLGSCVGKLPVAPRGDLKARRFVPQRVREKTIPKKSGRVRSLGIPTAADRVVQASSKLVLETETIPLGVTMPGSQPTPAAVTGLPESEKPENLNG